MSLHYQLSEKAAKDIADFQAYLVNDNGKRVSDEFVHAIFDKFKLLSEFPGIGRKRDKISKGLHSFVEVKYNRTIFYRIRKTHIFITRVLSSHQDHQSHLR